MNLDFFFFMVFMSISSFALAFVVYVAILKIFGNNKWLEMILVPACVVMFDFVVLVVGSDYKYFLGSVPLAVVAGMLGYAYFFKEIPLGGNNAVVNDVSREEKRYSAKSARIHAARAKRGRN